MSAHRIRLQERNLDVLFTEVSTLSEGEIIKAHLARYLCVRTSGYLENVVKALISNYCDGTSPRPIQSFILSKTKNTTNLNYTKILRLLAEFSPEWKDKFESKLSDQQKSSLNSVVSNRNNIAHGNPDSITFNGIKKYYEDIKDVISILKSIIKK